jgi:hypothetical protein
MEHSTGYRGGALAGIVIKLPTGVTQSDNGAVRDELLVGCGVFSSFSPHRELKMHHRVAARAMRAMVKEAAVARKLGQVRATGTYRTLDQQKVAFDGTIPANRTDVNGRYIPKELWDTFSPGQLDDEDVKSWKGKLWKRRKGTVKAASPGTSNHGLGLAVDFDQGQLDSWLQWLRDNAARFGFVDEVSSEDWHWSYRLGDEEPPALIDLPPDEDEDEDEDEDDDDDDDGDNGRRHSKEEDMTVIDFAPNTPGFTRLVISGRIKWVRGGAAAALDKMEIDKFEVERPELVDLLRSFGTEGLSPFNGISRNAAPDAELDQAWEDARLT